jgi:hypothetical protein
LAAIRYVGNRTFYNSGGRWYDSKFDNTQASKVQNVKIGSDEFTNLLKNSPSLAKYMSQGDVVVEYQGNWYRFEPAKTKLELMDASFSRRDKSAGQEPTRGAQASRVFSFHTTTL